MAKPEKCIDVRIDRQGRVVVPSSIRRALSFLPNRPLVARVEGGRLIIEKRETVLARIKSRFSRVPKGVDLANELIGERRKEAERERGRP